ncbi:MAG: DMT family transporter [Verrucomicrobiaceae bacterium]
MFSSEALAIAAAACFALTSMFLAELRGRVPLFQLTRWQMVATFMMTGFISILLGGWRTVGPVQFWQLAGSSVAGIAIASTTYFATIYAMGPRITALLYSLTAPFAVVLGYIVYGETINIPQGLGILLVLAGILSAIGIHQGLGLDVRDEARGKAKSPEASGAAFKWAFLPGIGFGIITALGTSVGNLLARPAMAAGVEPFTAMALRSGLAALIFIILSATPLGNSSRQPLRAGALWLATASAFMGATLGMSLLMAALHTGNVGIVSTLSSMTPVLILPMVWVRSGSRPSLAAWFGAIFAVAGTALITLS